MTALSYAQPSDNVPQLSQYTRACNRLAYSPAHACIYTALCKLSWHMLTCAPLSFSQAAICGGYLTPLFIAYVVEKRAKLAFARKNGLLRETLSMDGSGQFNVALGSSIESNVIVALTYVNMLILGNLLVVIVISHSFGDWNESGAA